MSVTKTDLLLYHPDINRIRIRGPRVLVLPDQEVKDAQDRTKEVGGALTKGGIFIPTEVQADDVWAEKQKVLMQPSGIVVKIGNDNFKEEEVWLKKGDRVFFKRYCGEDMEAIDGKIYKIIFTDDITHIEDQEGT